MGSCKDGRNLSAAHTPRVEGWGKSFQTMIAAAFPSAPQHAPEVVVVERDDTRIERSCTIRFPSEPLHDADGDGVVQVVADGIELVFEGTLSGAEPGAMPDQFQGLGIAVSGKGVKLQGARVRGFRAGIVARRADGLVLEGCDVSGNFRQRLRSTQRREDERDWLTPHDNDADEWLSSYGAGIWIEDSRGVTVRDCRAREGQNGLVLDRVEESKVYDNDFSFLSGWGIALWRSSKNVIAHNACDFCVRGYSHEVYNRGQDSAGILMFEQCSDNVIAENSATHCGDGLFGFAGQEALGARPAPYEDFDYTRRGNNCNVIVRNDFSYAAAHGIEMTFSFGNQIRENKLVGNAICGVWAGYSQDTTIQSNEIAENGEGAYGLERGGINIEHGQRNNIGLNRFRQNVCGIRLWSDSDEHLAKLPWVQANGDASLDNSICSNHFEADAIGIELLQTADTTAVGNRFVGVEQGVLPDDFHEAFIIDPGAPMLPLELVGTRRPVGTRDELAGRDKILVTEWGPYDWTSPLLWPKDTTWIPHRYARLGGATEVEALGDVTILPIEVPEDVEVVPNQAGVTSYELRLANSPLHVWRGVLVNTSWRVRFFVWIADPLTDEAAWRAEGEASAHESTARTLDFDFQDLGPGQFLGKRVAPDRFGTIAETELRFPPGKYALRTTSDDGVRLWVGEELEIDAWNDHGRREDACILELAEEEIISVRLEHYDRTGPAILRFEIELAE